MGNQDPNIRDTYVLQKKKRYTKIGEQNIKLYQYTKIIYKQDKYECEDSKCLKVRKATRIRN